MGLTPNACSCCVLEGMPSVGAHGTDLCLAPLCTHNGADMMRLTKRALLDLSEAYEAIY